MNPPPNPHEQQARAVQREYMRPLLVNPPANDAPPPPDLDAALARIAATWPDMLHYVETARIEPLHHRDGWCWGVTVTIFDKEQQP